MPSSEQRFPDSPANRRETSTRPDRRPTPASGRTGGCKPRAAGTNHTQMSHPPVWKRPTRTERPAPSRLTFPRTISLLFPLRMSSRRQQTSSFCCRGKLSPSEPPFCAAIRSPYTSDSTRATWGRVTRDAAFVRGQGENSKSSRSSVSWTVGHQDESQLNSPGVSTLGLDAFFLSSDSTTSTALLKENARSVSPDSTGKHTRRPRNQPRLLPADVQSFPGVPRHRRHLPGAELNGGGVHDPVGRSLTEDEGD